MAKGAWIEKRGDSQTRRDDHQGEGTRQHVFSDLHLHREDEAVATADLGRAAAVTIGEIRRNVPVRRGGRS